MADATTNLPTIDVNQAQKETVANALFDAGSPGTYWGRDFETTGGLTWGYYGGVMLIAGLVTRFANGTRTLTNNATNYVELTAAGSVTSNTTGFSYGTTKPLYRVFTSGGLITDYDDFREWSGGGGASGQITVDAQDGIIIIGSPVALGGTVRIETPLIAKGDLLVVRDQGGSPNLILERLPVGADGEILTADSAQQRGMQWAPVDPTGGGSGIIFPEVTTPVGPGPVGSPPTYGLFGAVWNDDLERPILVDKDDIPYQLGERHRREIHEVIPHALSGLETSPSGFTLNGSGGATAYTIGGTRYTASPRFRYTSAASINTSVGWVGQNSQVHRNTNTNAGGFFLQFIFGCGPTNSDSRAAIGIDWNNSALGGSQQPSARTGLVYMALDSGDTNWQLMHNDSSGTATKVNLGASFPRPTSETSVYAVRIWCPPTGANLKYHIQRLDDPAQTAGGTLTTDLIPAANALFPMFYLNTGPTTATAVSLDLFRMYLERRIY